MVDRSEESGNRRDGLEQFPRRAIAVAVSAACGGAYAQESSQGAIEEIVVTATKRAESMQDIPISITAFTDDDIVKQGFKQLDDYIGQIPSLSYAVREPGGANVVMRGCVVSGIAFSDNPTSAVYLDEQPITSAGFNPDPRLVDIQRVEAVSGPQGTLFGDASQCGTLRIITNKADTEQLDAWIDVTGTSVKSGGTGYDVSGMVNIPLVEDTLALRLVGFVAEEPGYIDNVLGSSPGETFDNAAYTKNNVNDVKTVGGRAALRWTPSDAWTIDGMAMFQDVEQDGFGDSSVADTFYEDRSIGKWEQWRFNEDKWSDEWYQLALTVEGDLGFANWTTSASFMNRNTRYDADSTAYLFAWQVKYPDYDIYDFGGDPKAFSNDDGEVDRWTFETRLATPSDSSSRWSGLLGFFYNKAESETIFRANVEGYSDSCAGGIAAADQSEDCSRAWVYLSYVRYFYLGTFPDNPNDNWWHGAYEDTLEEIAVFGEVTFDVTENFSITAGGRWFDVEADRTLQNGFMIADPEKLDVDCGDKDGWQVDGNPQSGESCWTDESAKSSESGFVPKVNLTYHIQNDKMVYFTYSEGFRRGGVNAAKPSSIFGAGNEFHEFDSDLLTNYEVGAKTTWADGRFQFNIAAYHMVWDDIQIEAQDTTEAAFTLGVVKFDEAEIDGFEADIIWVPTDGLMLGGTLGYNDAKLSKDAALFGETVVEKGTRLPISPKWKGSVYAEYTFTGTWLGASPFVRADYLFQDKSLSSLEGIQSIDFVLPVREQPSYQILDLRFGLEAEVWSAAFFIDNVTNEYAQQYFNDRWAQTRLTVNRPRTVGLSFRRYFGR
jgi:outer membrane receptor protein involved in Fe transport